MNGNIDENKNGKGPKLSGKLTEQEETVVLFNKKEIGNYFGNSTSNEFINNYISCDIYESKNIPVDDGLYYNRNRDSSSNTINGKSIANGLSPIQNNKPFANGYSNSNRNSNDNVSSAYFVNDNGNSLNSTSMFYQPVQNRDGSQETDKFHRDQQIDDELTTTNNFRRENKLHDSFKPVVDRSDLDNLNTGIIQQEQIESKGGISSQIDQFKDEEVGLFQLHANCSLSLNLLDNPTNSDELQNERIANNLNLSSHQGECLEQEPLLEIKSSQNVRESDYSHLNIDRSKPILQNTINLQMDETSKYMQDDDQKNKSMEIEQQSNNKVESINITQEDIANNPNTPDMINLNHLEYNVSDSRIKNHLIEQSNISLPDDANVVSFNTSKRIDSNLDNQNLLYNVNIKDTLITNSQQNAENFEPDNSATSELYNSDYMPLSNNPNQIISKSSSSEQSDSIQSSNFEQSKGINANNFEISDDIRSSNFERSKGINANNFEISDGIQSSNFEQSNGIQSNNFEQYNSILINNNVSVSYDSFDNTNLSNETFQNRNNLDDILDNNALTSNNSNDLDNKVYCSSQLLSEPDDFDIPENKSSTSNKPNIIKFSIPDIPNCHLIEYVSKHPIGHVTKCKILIVNHVFNSYYFVYENGIRAFRAKRTLSGFEIYDCKTDKFVCKLKANIFGTKYSMKYSGVINDLRNDIKAFFNEKDLVYDQKNDILFKSKKECYEISNNSNRDKISKDCSISVCCNTTRVENDYKDTSSTIIGTRAKKDCKDTLNTNIEHDKIISEFTNKDLNRKISQSMSHSEEVACLNFYSTSTDLSKLQDLNENYQKDKIFNDDQNYGKSIENGISDDNLKMPQGDFDSSLSVNQPDYSLIKYECIGSEKPTTIFKPNSPLYSKGLKIIPELCLGSIDIIYETSFLERGKPRVFKINNNDITLINKKPYYNVETNSFSLNFNGRVTKPSVKNFQVIHPLDPTYITLTFGKEENDSFILDFTYPWSALNAFCVGLSSLDHKFGCD